MGRTLLLVAAAGDDRFETWTTGVWVPHAPWVVLAGGACRVLTYPIQKMTLEWGVTHVTPPPPPPFLTCFPPDL